MRQLLLFCAAALCSLHLCFGQTTVWYNEEFNDNSRGWPVGDGEKSGASIANGKFAIELRARDEGSWTWYGSSVFIDPNKDYIIESTISQLSGV